MIELKDYVPNEVKFQLSATVEFPEVIFENCACMEDVKKELSEHFVTVQEKDVTAARIMDDFEISTIRANYGEIAEEQIPELEERFEALKAEFHVSRKEFEAKISSLHTHFKDLVNLARKGVRDYPLETADTFRIPVTGYYLYYSWVNQCFRLASVQEIPEHEQNDLFNSGETNRKAFEQLGYELPHIPARDDRQNACHWDKDETASGKEEDNDKDSAHQGQTGQV